MAQARDCAQGGGLVANTTVLVAGLKGKRPNATELERLVADESLDTLMHFDDDLTTERPTFVTHLEHTDRSN